jgi:endonuclease/exonuclease/phosphatase family metal-dependent hydrolase
MGEGERRRLVTFNLKHGAQADKRLTDPGRLAKACEELKKIDPDILALQEVDRGTVRAKGAHVDTIIASALGMNHVFAPTMQFNLGRYGNALLVRGDIDDPEELRLRGGRRFKREVFGHKFKFGSEPRNAILATACGISVAATHLSTEKNLSQRQLPRILDALGKRPGPHVVMGDFNRTPEEVENLLGSMERVDSSETFRAPNPDRTIDHIAVSGLTICTSRVEQLPISDHLALIADVEIPEL